MFSYILGLLLFFFTQDENINYEKAKNMKINIKKLADDLNKLYYLFYKFSVYNRF